MGSSIRNIGSLFSGIFLFARLSSSSCAASLKIDVLYQMFYNLLKHCNQIVMDTNKIKQYIQQSDFLAKYFEVKDSQLTCRKDAFFGLSNDKIYEKCVLIYADLKNEITNEEILTTFRDATVDFIKSINYVRNVHSSI